jgi:hypothetical protein
MDWTTLHRLHEIEVVAAGSRRHVDAGRLTGARPGPGAPQRRPAPWAAAVLGRVAAVRRRAVVWGAPVACATCA